MCTKEKRRFFIADFNFGYKFRANIENFNLIFQKNLKKNYLSI